MGAGRFREIKSTVGRFWNFPVVSGGVPELSRRLQRVARGIQKVPWGCWSDPEVTGRLYMGAERPDNFDNGG
jgi:hypothetical protein